MSPDSTPFEFVVGALDEVTDPNVMEPDEYRGLLLELLDELSRRLEASE